MKALLAFPLLFVGLQFPVLADTILPGTEIQVRIDHPIQVDQWDRGRIYPAYVARDVVAADGDVTIPRGSYAEMIVRQVGPDRMALDLESITVNDHRYVMDTSGPQFHMSENQYNNGGGLVGGIIGAIAGATGTQVETQGNRIYVPGDTVLRFRLDQPLHTADWRDPGYENNNYHYHRDHDWYR